jgi:hypothetical protein
MKTFVKELHAAVVSWIRSESFSSVTSETSHFLIVHGFAMQFRSKESLDSLGEIVGHMMTQRVT